jgi:hypothetical protein
MTKQTKPPKLALGALLIGASALPMGSFVSDLVGNIGTNWVSEAVGNVLPGGPPLAASTALEQAYTQALRRTVTQLRQEYQREYGAQEQLGAFALLQQSIDAVAQAEYPAGVGDIGMVQRVLASNLDVWLHGHPERQVVFIKTRLLEQMARNFQEELSAHPEAWRLFEGWLLQRMIQQNAELRTAIARLPESQFQHPDMRRALIDAASNRLDDELNTIRDELYNIATGQPSATASGERRYLLRVQDDAQVGTAVAGDVHGNITVNQHDSGFRAGSGNTFGDLNVGDIAGGNIDKKPTATFERNKRKKKDKNSDQ